MSRIHRTNRKLSSPVGFRLPTLYHDRLVEEAASMRLSPGRYARQLVMSALSDDDTDEQTRDEIGELRREVALLHEHLAAATVAVLHDAGKASLEEATQWVHRTLIPEAITRTYPNTGSPR